MVNIHCSENCKHEKDGNCCLSCITISSSYIGYNSDCAYFHPKTSP
ncbi:MAG: hydroxymyristoyl-ACP dehydratase [Clostridium sp.]